MKHFFLCWLLCIAILASYAQPATAPTEKTLLWRISGKGLTRPSYLYGTMHLTDERLFNFSDSLLLAIEKTDGFAIEVDPDEMMTVVMEQMFQDSSKSKLLKEVVSKQAFDKYAPILSKRIKKPKEDITVKDVVQEQNKWMDDAYKKGTMPTFVDTWLYDIARRQGKWVGGIEDVQDQAGLLEDVFNEQDLEFLTADYTNNGQKFLNNIIDTYIRQDLEGIEAISNVGGQAQKDKLLLHRNVKMAYRMDSLSAVRNMVFAVGAAHLPGDSGVISLLRKKGFRVDPVFSSQKIAGKNYQVAPKPLAWQKITDNEGLYEVEMPGKASVLKMYGVLEMRMNVNLFTSSGYMTMAVPTTQSIKEADAGLLDMARKMMLDPKLKQGEPVVKNGITGREYISKKDGEFKRAQLFASGQVLYVAFSFFKKEEGLTSEDANRFFKSLHLNTAKLNAETGMVSFTGLFPGVQGQAPVALTPNKELLKQFSEPDYETDIRMGLDTKKGAVYMLIEKNTINSMFIPNDSVYLSLIRENYRARVGQSEIDTLKLENGMYTLEQKGIYKKEQVLFHGKSFFRGNRCYSLFAIVPKDKENEKMAGEVIRTFKVAVPTSANWADRNYQNQFSTWLPANIIEQAKDTSTTEQTNLTIFNARDTISSYVYSVMRTPLDSTTWYNNRADYWEKTLKYLDTDPDDTILVKQPFTANGLEGYDIAIGNKTFAGKTKQYRLLTYGDTAYTLFTSIPTDEVKNTDIRRFFTDFKFAKPAPAATIFTSKAPQFIARLSATDSLTRKVAYSGVSDANFSSQDIPLLHQALLQHYSWDTGSNYYYPLQIKIGNKLSELEDSSLSDFIKSNYNKPNGRDEEEQTALLKFLCDAPTTANMQFVVNALKKIDGTAKIYSPVIYYLNDSINLLTPVTSDVLSLLKNKNMVQQMLYIVKDMQDSGLVQVKEIMPYEQEILAFGNEKLNELNKEPDEDGYELNATAKIAGSLNTVNSIALLQKIAQAKSNDVKIQAVYGLQEAGKPLPQDLLLAIATMPSKRSELLRTLTDKHQENLFPVKYKNQQSLAESNLYEYITDEDYSVSQLTFVKVTKSVVNGKAANVYIYKMAYKEDDDNKLYLAAIAFSTDAKILEPLEYAYSVLWDEEYDTKKQEKQIKKLLEKLQEDSSDE